MAKLVMVKHPTTGELVQAVRVAGGFQTGARVGSPAVFIPDAAAPEAAASVAADAAPAADRAAFFAAATAIIAAAMSSCADSSVRTKRAFTSSHAAALL